MATTNNPNTNTVSVTFATVGVVKVANAAGRSIGFANLNEVACRAWPFTLIDVKLPNDAVFFNTPHAQIDPSGNGTSIPTGPQRWPI
jgi:hypothetical protein